MRNSLDKLKNIIFINDIRKCLSHGCSDINFTVIWGYYAFANKIKWLFLQVTNGREIFDDKNHSTCENKNLETYTGCAIYHELCLGNDPEQMLFVHFNNQMVFGKCSLKLSNVAYVK